MAKKKKNQNVGIIILILVLLLGGVLASLQFFGVVNLLSIVGYESVYKAHWGHICCEEGAYEPPYIRYLDNEPLYKCNSYTDECRIRIHPSQDLGLFNRIYYYQICDINGLNCGGKIREGFNFYDKKEETITHIINYGRSIKFSAYPLNAKDLGYIKYEADYRKFYIQGVENGKIFVAKSCILDADLKKRVLLGGLNELSKVGSNRCQNYITDYILVDTKTYSYSGKEVLCQARNLYDIDLITLLDGSSRKIQAERIKSVDCCPHEANCGFDFKFKEVEKDCDYSYQCPNGGEPVALTGTSYVKFNCINNKCVQSNPVNVECTNNAICVNKMNKPNAVCVNFKCEIDDSWLGFCGDGICESILGETASSCPEDCGAWSKDFNWWWVIGGLIIFVLLIIIARRRE